MNACPYCSLLCFPNQLGGIDHCAKRRIALTAQRDPAFACTSVDGKAADYSEAVHSFARCLSSATHILITGHINSLETSRAVLKLARTLDAYVDLKDSTPMFDWVESVQEIGCTTTSLSEARYRSDLVVVLQSDEVLSEFPLALEQLVLNHDRLTPQPKVLFINSTNVDLQNLSCAELCEQIGESSTLDITEADLYGFLRACTAKATDRVPMDLMSKAQLLRSALLTASYPVILFSTSMAVHHQRTIYSLLNQLTTDLSTINRIHLLPLQASSLQFTQACTWQTGYPGRVHFINGLASYGPRAFSASQLLIEHKGSLTTLTLDETVRNSSILIKDNRTEIRIPVAWAGIENTATLIKADGSIMLNVECDSKQRSAASVLQELNEALAFDRQSML